jgi:ABC-2 type transport system permease protein
MSKVLVVARWEYLERVKSKAFLIGLFLTPIIMIGMGILPSVFATQEDKETVAIGIIDRSGDIAREFAERMEGRYALQNGRPNYAVRPIAVGQSIDLGEAVREANNLVATGQIEGYCIVGGIVATDSVVEYRSRSVGDFRVGVRMEETLKGILAEHRVLAMGLDPKVLKELAVNLNVHMVKLSKAGEKEEAGFEKVFFSAFVFLMMMFFLIATSGQILVRSVIEEKANRIVEMLVSSCSPTELMAGKVIGLSGLAFTQLGFWAVVGVGASVQFGMDIINPAHALLLVVYFILGYLFYAAVFIGAGSPLTTEQEAQQVNTYLVLLLVLPMMLALPAMKDPEALWLRVLTFIPFFTPTMMALRVPIQVPALWEVLVTIVLMVLSIYVVMVAAGRVFRIAILSTGKSPKIGEILRWARSG